MKTQKIRDILDKYKIRPSKGLGQHFLIDENIVKSQIEFANISDHDVVLEIGPGLGILTLELSKHARKVIAIEKDRKLGEYLATAVPSNVELIIDDALSIEFPKFDKIVANLPYRISSPLSFKLRNYDFQSATMMYQKEFAERIVARPRTKSYSRLTVNMYYSFNSEIIKLVPKEAFYPKPKVDAAIVQLIPRKPPFKVVDDVLFFKMVTILFSQRRKKIKNSLRNNYKLFNIGKEKFQESLVKIPYKDNRPEELTPEELGDLANIIAMLDK